MQLLSFHDLLILLSTLHLKLIHAAVCVAGGPSFEAPNSIALSMCHVHLSTCLLTDMGAAAIALVCKYQCKILFLLIWIPVEAGLLDYVLWSCFDL